jgi:hypothetical protein
MRPSGGVSDVGVFLLSSAWYSMADGTIRRLGVDVDYHKVLSV